MPDCDVGAMPPFGSLYGTDAYAAEVLSENDEMGLNAGIHSEIIKDGLRGF